MVIFDGQDRYYSYSYPKFDIEINPFEKKNIVYKVRMMCDWGYSGSVDSPAKVNIGGSGPVNISLLYLINNDGNYVDCNALTKKNKQDAIVINVVK